MIISFLASHGGSAAKHLIAAFDKGEVQAQLGVIITNNKNADIYGWGKQQRLPIEHISGRTHASDDAKDRAIVERLKQVKTDLVVLSGYMKKLGPLTLAHYQNRILNIHPSLLPAHGGKGMFGDNVHRSVLASGDKVSGATVQFVTQEYDAGPIICQQQVEVLATDELATLKQRVQAIEGGLYLQALQQVMTTAKKD